MVHHIRQHLLMSKGIYMVHVCIYIHPLMDTSSRDTCFLSYCRASQLQSLHTRVPIKITCGKCFGVATFKELEGAVAFLLSRNLLTYFLIGAEIKDPLCC